MSIVDRKYIGVITKADGTVVNDWIIFRAKDKAMIDTLIFYRAACQRLGCEKEHIGAIEELLLRVTAYQEENPEKVKVPDTKEEDIIFHALDGK